MASPKPGLVSAIFSFEPDHVQLTRADVVVLRVPENDANSAGESSFTHDSIISANWLREYVLSGPALFLTCQDCARSADAQEYVAADLFLDLSRF